MSFAIFCVSQSNWDIKSGTTIGTLCEEYLSIFFLGVISPHDDTHCSHSQQFVEIHYSQYCQLCIRIFSKVVPLSVLFAKDIPSVASCQTKYTFFPETAIWGNPLKPVLLHIFLIFSKVNPLSVLLVKNIAPLFSGACSHTTYTLFPTLLSVGRRNLHSDYLCLLLVRMLQP